MFIPNTTAILHRMTGRNPFGRPAFAAGVPVRIAIVDLASMTTPSAVRADQSASRGSAEQDTDNAKLALPKTLKVKEGDVFEVDDFHIQVTGIIPRRNVLGQLDHYEVTGKAQAGPIS